MPHVKHGEARDVGRTPEYRAWSEMRGRCYRRSHHKFHNYGGRGITVCDAWRGSYAAFLAHLGRRPSPDHSVDRIDNDGPYAPGNVRWATRGEQARNRRPNALLTAFGRTQCLVEWAEQVGLGASTIAMRLRSGWDVERALSQPVRRRYVGS